MRGLGNWLRSGVDRTSVSLWQIFLAAASATLAFWTCTLVWGHEQPFFSAITAFLIVGFTLETKVKKSIDMSVGILLGIILGDVARMLIGSGGWQLFVTLLVSVTLARFAKGSVIFTIQVAVQSMVVLLLPLTPSMSPASRALDAVTGIVIALVIHLLFSPDPRKMQRRAADDFFSQMTLTLRELAEAADTGNAQLASTALTHIREASQRHTDDWMLANETANEITSYSPSAHRYSEQVRRIQYLLVGSDRAMRNTRVIARRQVEFLRVTGGDKFPHLAAALRAAAEAINAIQTSVDTDVNFTEARRTLRFYCSYLTPETILTTNDSRVGRLGHFEGISLVTQLRALAVDLIEATGVPSSDARRFLPSLVMVSDADIVGPRPVTREIKAVEPPASTEALELIITDRTDPNRKMEK